jgi:hypothetical protein
MCSFKCKESLLITEVVHREWHFFRAKKLLGDSPLRVLVPSDPTLKEKVLGVVGEGLKELLDCHEEQSNLEWEALQDLAVDTLPRGDRDHKSFAILFAQNALAALSDNPTFIQHDNLRAWCLVLKGVVLLGFKEVICSWHAGILGPPWKRFDRFPGNSVKATQMNINIRADADPELEAKIRSVLDSIAQMRARSLQREEDELYSRNNVSALCREAIHILHTVPTTKCLPEQLVVAFHKVSVGELVAEYGRLIVEAGGEFGQSNFQQHFKNQWLPLLCEDGQIRICSSENDASQMREIHHSFGRVMDLVKHTREMMDFMNLDQLLSEDAEDVELPPMSKREFCQRFLRWKLVGRLGSLAEKPTKSMTFSLNLARLFPLELDFMLLQFNVPVRYTPDTKTLVDDIWKELKTWFRQRMKKIAQQERKRAVTQVLGKRNRDGDETEDDEF